MNKKIIVQPGCFPEKSGLYDPALEKDSCGVGFVANIKGQASHQIMLDAHHINARMDHRGGCGFEENTGDGAGVLTALVAVVLIGLAYTLEATLSPPLWLQAAFWAPVTVGGVIFTLRLFKTTLLYARY